MAKIGPNMDPHTGSKNGVVEEAAKLNIPTAPESDGPKEEKNQFGVTYYAPAQYKTTRGNVRRDR